GGLPTVQASLQRGLSRVANVPVAVICAGRTDAGVHALEQVVHFDTEAERSAQSWVRGTNTNIERAITVLWAKPVSNDFHARFSAVSRRYRYVILNRSMRSSLASGRVTWEYRPLDAVRMAEAGRYLLGEWDFTSYRAVACQSNTPFRNVTRLDVSRHDDLVFIDIEANAFLHHMVRNIAGVLMDIGAGERSPDWASEVLAARDRTAGGVTAPPHGLYLMAVGYPPEFGVPHLSNTQLVW
ncbi:tRNA pseudouridine(38-40) synthase, partial [hydrothermal vent metagenome]